MGRIVGCSSHSCQAIEESTWEDNGVPEEAASVYLRALSPGAGQLLFSIVYQLPLLLPPAQACS